MYLFHTYIYIYTQIRVHRRFCVEVLEFVEFLDLFLLLQFCSIAVFHCLHFVMQRNLAKWWKQTTGVSAWLPSVHSSLQRPK